MMKDQLSGEIDLLRLFDPASAQNFVDSLLLRGTSVARESNIVCAVLGQLRFVQDDSERIAKAKGTASALIDIWRKHGAKTAEFLRNGYSIAIVDAEKQCVYLAVDRFAIETICYRADGNTLAFSDRADCVAGTGEELDPQAIFDYLYFHMIPAPRTIFRNVKRLPAAHSILIDRLGLHESRHWPLNFNEHSQVTFPDARKELRELIRNSVSEEIEGNGKVGAFLSGGTDSSTVAGMLCEVAGKSAPTYSIGFASDGYDEMEYARLSAKHFGCDHHEYYVTPADLLESIPAVAQHHDQPFGNSSALPAYYCAKMAREDGCTKILAGDGGDELFGGNTRYSMQRFLEFYHFLPSAIRRLIEPVCTEESVWRKVPGLRQAMGYVRHSRVEMPHRLQTMNLLMQLGPANVFAESFLARVDVNEPKKHMQRTWDECRAPSLINRMLAFDWRYTLADSDLPKVRGATAMAGIAVGYPLLGDSMTDFSMGLRPSWKLRGFKLRWFFKEALRGFLPDSVITKKKQGFGLPYGPWMAKDPALRQLAVDSLNGLVKRGIVKDAFVSKLLEQYLSEHPAYYGNMIWVLMMLEQWLRGQTEVKLVSSA
jgi:asparagine synthase (glutamine-hydrolysing)